MTSYLESPIDVKLIADQRDGSAAMLLGGNIIIDDGTRETARITDT